MVLEQQQLWTKIRGDESGRAKDQGICENVWTVKFNCMEFYGMFEQLACIRLKVHSNLIRAIIILHPINKPEIGSCVDLICRWKQFERHYVQRYYSAITSSSSKSLKAV